MIVSHTEFTRATGRQGDAFWNVLPLTNKGIRQLLTVEAVHIHRPSHVLIGEQIGHHSAGQSETVVCVDPILLVDLRSRVW